MFSYCSETDEEIEEIIFSPLFQKVSTIFDSIEKEKESLDNNIEQFIPPKLNSEQILYIILDFFERNDFESKNYEIIVRIWPGPGYEERYVHLRDEWINTKLSIGDPLFVSSQWELKNDSLDVYFNKLSTIIDNYQGFIVILPHILISGTQMSTALQCLRSAYFYNLLPPGEPSEIMFIGILAHDLLQRVLFGLTEEDVEHSLIQILNQNIETLYSLHETTDTFLKKMQELIFRIKLIAKDINNNKSNFNYLNFKNIEGVYSRIDSYPPYNGIPTTKEENLWSFQYGLKGQIDITLENEGLLYPLELKSGASDRGNVRNSGVLQLSSYIFLMKEKYKNKSSPAGVLYYMKDNVSYLIKPRQIELLHIIIKRNFIAYALSHSKIPPTSSDKYPCKFCSSINICSFFDDGKSPLSDFLQNYLPFKTSKRDFEFYNYWESFHIEEMQKYRNDQTMIWSTPLSSRISSGKALSQLSTSNGKNPIVEFFIKDKDNIFNSHIQISSYVMITRFGKPPIIGRGIIISIDQNKVTIEIIESSLEESEDNITLDIWDSDTTIKTCRTNLISLFSLQTPNSQKIKQLIVDSKPPIFLPLPQNIPIMDLNMNEDQILAIKKAISSQDYMLLLGMPGTGKTTTVATIIESFLKLNQTVLIVSHTHTAVDNLCIKLIERNIKFLRTGRHGLIDPKVERYSTESLINKCETTDLLNEELKDIKVFASTCLGYSHPFIIERNFDVCVIDEASQITMTTVLGPLLYCKKFILVGDHYQLPPILKIKSDLSINAPPSLFKALSESHPESIVTLRTQYRMNNDILKLCNSLVYSEKMRQGNSFAANSFLKFPDLNFFINSLPEFHLQYLIQILQPKPSIQFINTDLIPIFFEKSFQGSKMNSGEAYIISIIVVSMILSGVNPNLIGIISPYRAQILLLKKLISAQILYMTKYYSNSLNNPEDIIKLIEIHTVDKFQGRDKDCIIFSAVKSNSKTSPGNHVSDWQRLNVSITRSKKKLIFIGSKITLNNSPFFNDLLKNLSQNNFINLPPGIDEFKKKPFLSFSYFNS